MLVSPKEYKNWLLFKSYYVFIYDKQVHLIFPKIRCFNATKRKKKREREKERKEGGKEGRMKEREINRERKRERVQRAEGEL